MSHFDEFLKTQYNMTDEDLVVLAEETLTKEEYGEWVQQDLYREVKVNSMGVLIREWRISVNLFNPKTNDYTTISTSVYHTNEAMAKTEGVKKLQERLNLDFEVEDWSYKVSAEVVDDVN